MLYESDAGTVGPMSRRSSGVLRRVGEAAYRGSVVCLLACVAGCVGDTEPGEGRGRGDVIVVNGPTAGSKDPPASSGHAGSSAEPPSSTGGASAGSVASAGTASMGAGAGAAGQEPVVPPPPPLDERVFDAGSDPNRNKVTAGAVCARLAQIQCAGEAFCCPNPTHTVPQCEEISRAGCVDEAYLDMVTANPIVAFDATKAAEAFTKFEELASQCDLSIAEYGASATGLMSMLRGTLAAGKSCSPKGFEKSSAAASLAACTNVETTACLPTSALLWTCTARGGAGAQCFSDLNCQDGLHCPNPNLLAGTFGTASCAARKPAGMPCAQPNECTSFACTGGMCQEPSAEAAYCLTN